MNKSKRAEDSDVVWSAWIGLPSTVPGMLPGMFPFAAAQASIQHHIKIHFFIVC